MKKKIGICVLTCFFLLAACPPRFESAPFYGLAAKERAAAVFCVVLDAGHGGIDGGVRGRRTKTKESELNLSVTKLLGRKLTEAKFRVVYTRETEDGLYGMPTPGFKRRDMETRKKIIETEKPDVVLSVHMNFYPAENRRGGQAFYRKESESGRRLAAEIQKRFNLLSERSYEPLSADLFMLRCTEAPSVLAECGFLSNAEDERLLCDAAYREKLADALFFGLTAFLLTAY